MTTVRETVVWPWSAAVHAEDGVRYVVFAPSREDLALPLARYVAERAPYVLWPADAERVLALLDAGYVDAAIHVYFARVGYRWDDEWLRITLSREAPAATSSDAGDDTWTCRTSAGKPLPVRRSDGSSN